MKIEVFSSSKSFQVFGAVVALLAFFVPVSCVIVFFMVVRGFVPTERLNDFAIYLSYVNAATFLVLLVPRQLQRMKVAVSEHAVWAFLKGFVLLLFAPVFGAAIAQMFVIYPVSYSLHRLEHPIAAVKEEMVISAWHGRRICRYRAKLNGGTWLFPRQVCDISPEAVTALENGGAIRLYGLESSYGFQVERYSYAGNGG